MDFSEFAVAVDLYEDGKEIELGEGCSITVRSAGSDKAQRVRERLWKPYASFRKIPDDVMDKLNAQWLAQAIIVTWKGFTLNGKAVDFDAAKAAEMLAKPEFKAFRGKILSIALNEENFRKAEEAAAAKN